MTAHPRSSGQVVELAARAGTKEIDTDCGLITQVSVLVPCAVVSLWLPRFAGVEHMYRDGGLSQHVVAAQRVGGSRPEAAVQPRQSAGTRLAEQFSRATATGRVSPELLSRWSAPCLSGRSLENGQQG